MSILSKSETKFLQGQKQVSKSYEYKLKSIIRRKITNLRDKELPLLSQLLPNIDLTKFSKILNINNGSPDLTKNSKIARSTRLLKQDCNKELDIIPQNAIISH